jgi:hypothetical protein
MNVVSQHDILMSTKHLFYGQMENIVNDLMPYSAAWRIQRLLKLRIDHFTK